MIIFFYKFIFGSLVALLALSPPKFLALDVVKEVINAPLFLLAPLCKGSCHEVTEGLFSAHNPPASHTLSTLLCTRRAFGIHSILA